ncbi:MAG TPA: FAD-dependent oxidoreductase, partial [Arenimonas sp.]|nr:FAD-dependent oxidoreductase [Arenimonas sp.]
DALLTRAVLASACELGAQGWCPAELLAAERVPQGYDLRILRDASEVALRCRFLINAAGPWSAVVRERVQPALPLQAVDCVLGSHLVIEPRLSERAFYLESPSDGRAVFALPWKGRTLLGTTEHVYRGDPDRVAPPLSDTDYLLGVLAHYFPTFEAQVIDRFAGLRVLPAGDGSAFRRPRECVLQRDPQHPRLLNLSGGKLTGYRAIAERVAATLRVPLGARKAIADTAELRLPRLDASLQSSPSASSSTDVQRA